MNADKSKSFLKKSENVFKNVKALEIIKFGKQLL